MKLGRFKALFHTA